MKLSLKNKKTESRIAERRQKLAEMRKKMQEDKVEDELPINADTAEVIFSNDDLQVIIAESPVTEDGESDNTIKVIVATNKEDNVEDEEILAATEVSTETEEEKSEECNEKKTEEKKCESKRFDATRRPLIKK